MMSIIIIVTGVATWLTAAGIWAGNLITIAGVLRWLEAPPAVRPPWLVALGAGAAVLLGNFLDRSRRLHMVLIAMSRQPGHSVVAVDSVVVVGVVLDAAVDTADAAVDVVIAVVLDAVDAVAVAQVLGKAVVLETEAPSEVLVLGAWVLDPSPTENPNTASSRELTVARRAKSTFVERGTCVVTMAVARVARRGSVTAGSVAQMVAPSCRSKTASCLLTQFGGHTQAVDSRPDVVAVETKVPGT